MVNRRILPLIITLIATIFFVMLFFISSFITNKDKHNPLQQTIPGKTTASEAENIKYKKKESFQDNSVKFTTASNVTAREGQVITEGNLVALEKIPLPLDPKKRGYSSLSSYKKTFGEPWATKYISYYGEGLTKLIYPDKGVALTAQVSSNEVFEIEVFPAMSLDQYLAKWGKDLTDDPKEIGEH